jgi:DNA polymerase-3 subunit gamma/tau
LVRLAYASELPSPDELITRLQSAPTQSTGSASVPHRGAIGGGPPGPRGFEPAPRYGTSAVPAPQPMPQSLPAATPQAGPVALANPRTYLELVALAGERRDILLKTALEQQMRPIAFREKSIEVALVEGADPSVIQVLSRRLREWTGQTWGVSVSTRKATGPTMRDIKDQHAERARSEATDDPLVKAILDLFPGASVKVTLQEEQIPDTAYEDAFLEEREDE